MWDCCIWFIKIFEGEGIGFYLQPIQPSLYFPSYSNHIQPMLMHMITSLTKPPTIKVTALPTENRPNSPGLRPTDLKQNRFSVGGFSVGCFSVGSTADKQLVRWKNPTADFCRFLSWLVCRSVGSFGLNKSFISLKKYILVFEMQCPQCNLIAHFKTNR